MQLYENLNRMDKCLYKDSLVKIKIVSHKDGLPLDNVTIIGKL